MSLQTEEPRNAQSPDENDRKLRAADAAFPQTAIPKSNSRLLILGALALAVAAIVIVAASRRTSHEAEAAPAAAAGSAGTVKFLMEQQWLIKMKLAKVESKTIARQIASTGRIVPAAHNRAVVSPPVSGVISGGKLPVVGQKVTHGQTIAVLQQAPTASERAQIASETAQLMIENARIDAERRRLEQSANEAKARLNQAKAEYERAQKLYDLKVYSLRQLQAAEADFKASQSLYAAANEQLEALAGNAVDLEEIGLQTSFKVAAPISGTVVKVNKSLGEQVAAGEAIVEIINLDEVWLEAPIFERDLYRINRQGEAVFTTPADPAVEHKGTVINIGSVVDEQTRAATVTIVVKNPEHTLRIGMQANIRLDAGESVEAMIIPKEAVLDNEGKKIVYVLLSGEEFQRREVTLGDEYGDKVAILLGLNAGERVVTQGAYQLKLQELRPASAGEHTHET